MYLCISGFQAVILLYHPYDLFHFYKNIYVLEYRKKSVPEQSWSRLNYRNSKDLRQWHIIPSNRIV